MEFFSSYVPSEVVVTGYTGPVGEYLRSPPYTFEYVNSINSYVCRVKSNYTFGAKALGLPGTVSVPGIPKRFLERSKYTWRVDPDKERKQSFMKIVRSGSIKMTPLSVGSTETKYFVVSQTEREEFKGTWSSTAPSDYDPRVGYFEYFDCTRSPVRLPPFDGWVPPDQLIQVVRTVNRKTYGDVANLTVYDISSLDGDLSSTIENLKSDVNVALRKKWDLMTDLFEMRASLNMGKALLESAAKPLQTLRVVAKKLSKKGSAHNEAKQDWLGFRYGIMPIMYSINDLMELMKAKSKYQTTRATKTLSYSSSFSDVPDKECLFIVRSGTIRVNATAKGYFGSPALRKFSGTSLNMINSAWETIPYSLVVDWFSNFGDFLYSHTNASDMSMDSSMCYSVKKEISTQTYYKYRLPDGSYGHSLMKEEVVESYDRVPFNQSDIRLAINVNFSSWKRWLDAYSLSIGPLNKVLRRLTK